MTRPLLEERQIHPAIRERVGALHLDLVRQAQAAVAEHAVVVLGMAQNPFVKKARKALDASGVAHHDILIGSYIGAWRQRTAWKMWTGWPTLPMVFVKGQLVGGADDLQKLIASGELKRLLA